MASSDISWLDRVGIHGVVVSSRSTVFDAHNVKARKDRKHSHGECATTVRNHPFGRPRWRLYVYGALLVHVLLHQQLAAESEEDVDDMMVAGTKLKRAHHLYSAWTDLYRLSNKSGLSEPLNLRDAATAGSSFRGWVPPAPHLQDCQTLTRQSQEAEVRGPNGELPAWSTAQSPSCPPQPPWVRGADEDNLAMTRQAQADIWAHQFPVDCNKEGLKFVVATWGGAMGHGIGSGLHMASYSFSSAIHHGRIFVLYPGSFERANHDGCQGEYRGNAKCYFAPVTPAACVERAMALWKSQENPKYDIHNVESVLASDLPTVVFGAWQIGIRMEARAADKWGTPWRERPVSFEVLGNVPGRHSDIHLKVNWWLSQAVRFMLRWQTTYMCHITNELRHSAYGLQVALQVEAAKASLQRASKEMGTGGNAQSALSMAKDASLLDGFADSDEPYIPRPIISLHVRQGDKAGEMRLFSLAAHMWQVHRLRKFSPGLRHIWLSTEMQEVVDDANKYRQFSFLYSKNARQNGATSIFNYERSVGYEELVGGSFANLLISAESDYYVGTLGSNWCRLINELRLTNGRFKCGYISLNNYDEW
eukprot:jgi/Mesen1/1970/ME000147S01060